MKVLHFFKTYLPENFAGIERVIWNIAEGTYPLGVRSDVLSLSRQPSGAPLPIANHFAHQAKLDIYLASTGLSLSVFRTFEQLSRDADIVNFHFPWPMMDVVHLLKPPKCPTVVTYHSDIVRQELLLTLYRPLMHRFLGRVDHIVATSPNYLESSPTLQRYRNKTSVIPIGIDGTRPTFTLATLSKWRERLGAGFFLFLGVPRYYKGLEFLIEAAKISGLPLVIAGATRAEVESLVDGDLGGVQIVGKVSDEDKEALLELSKAFVFPSHLRSEAFGVALVEAARAGRPMISCEIGTATSFVNSDGLTGIVVPSRDARALASAMTQMSQNDEITRKMGCQARDWFESNFTAETMARGYRDLYEQILTRQRDRD
ncbi:glycosyltransferase [uncultured Devosia sp.]|uniref:glycosyltransferase n=1 Tax=uncultured Devosia sp. TaxID=211434 RepID=UPI0035CC77F6